MLSVIAAQNRNSPAQVVQKCARRFIDGTQCFHCDRLENVMSLQRSILGFLARGGHLSHRAGALNCQINVRESAVEQITVTSQVSDLPFANGMRVRPSGLFPSWRIPDQLAP